MLSHEDLICCRAHAPLPAYRLPLRVYAIVLPCPMPPMSPETTRQPNHAITVAMPRHDTRADTRYAAVSRAALYAFVICLMLFLIAVAVYFSLIIDA